MEITLLINHQAKINSLKLKLTPLLACLAQFYLTVYDACGGL